MKKKVKKEYAHHLRMAILGGSLNFGDLKVKKRKTA
jgi:hypothetical protein